MTLPVLFIQPKSRAKIGDTKVELWVSNRKIPFLMHSDALIAPVAPDLKMVFGIAKLARDYSADQIQWEAERVAPLAPGDAFVGTGAKYRYKYTALAVIFDEQKRTSADIIRTAVKTAFSRLSEKGVTTVIFPDLTDNLLSQPNWITDEQRAATAQTAAELMMEAIRTAGSAMKIVRIWAWDIRNAEIIAQAIHRTEQGGGRLAASY